MKKSITIRNIIFLFRVVLPELQNTFLSDPHRYKFHVRRRVWSEMNLKTFWVNSCWKGCDDNCNHSNNKTLHVQFTKKKKKICMFRNQLIIKKTKQTIVRSRIWILDEFLYTNILACEKIFLSNCCTKGKWSMMRNLCILTLFVIMCEAFGILYIPKATYFPWLEVFFF